VGDCAASPERPATDQVVRIGDCSKNIKGHLKTCSISELALTCGIKFESYGKHGTWNLETEMEPKPEPEPEPEPLY